MDTSLFPPRKSSLSPPRSTVNIRPILPANLNISSLLTFAKQPLKASSPVKRKPLPPNSPALSTNKIGASANNDQKLSPSSMVAGSEASSPLVVRDLDQFPRGQSPLLPSGSIARKPVNGGKENRSPATVPPPRTSVHHSRTPSDSSIQKQKLEEQEETAKISETAALSSRKRHPPSLKLNMNERYASDNIAGSRHPRTPGNKITQFFNWKSTALSKDDGDDSSTTELSDNGLSPSNSPLAISPQTSRYSARSVSQAVEMNKSNVEMVHDGALGSSTLHPSMADHDHSTNVGQLEGELREISYELAGSIKREMELEDLVEKLQSEAAGTGDDMRTSDYYSDSSASSMRHLGGNGNVRVEDIEKIKRESEQERARLRMDLSQKWQDERARRKALESQVQLLEGQVMQFRQDIGDTSRLFSRSKELEASLEDARQRLAEERNIKESFETLLAALRTDLKQHRTERDNLRDEVVPRLQAQLHSQTSEPPPPTFDFAKMQQEIQALRSENATLKGFRKSQQDLQHIQARFNTISEEGEPSSTVLRSPVGISRSNSLARAQSRATGLVRSGSLSRSNSNGGKSPIEPRELLADRMRDVELQRDALHSGMKALLARQECQNKEFQKKILALEQERDRAMLPPTPRRQGYEKEVRNLRQEINNLRQRTDEALTQKLQCEKGLGGLKMDLDRSEQETSTLRRLLKEHDIALPEHLSDSLQYAYRQLQQERIDAKALMEDDSFSCSLEEEQRLADQLRQSAERSEGLALQMSTQLATNQALRNRLALAIGRGEMNQSASTGQITQLETKLRALEETVTSAQQQSEAAVLKHEEEIRILKDAHNTQLQRLKAAGCRSPSSPGPQNKRGLAPLVSPMFIQRSPKLDNTTSGPGLRLDQALRTETLEKKVAELEAALENADKEMQQVVGRMNTAQIEVMELQTERDEALKQTKKLQGAIMAERENVQSLTSNFKIF